MREGEKMQNKGNIFMTKQQQKQKQYKREFKNKCTLKINDLKEVEITE